MNRSADLLLCTPSCRPLLIKRPVDPSPGHYGSPRCPWASNPRLASKRTLLLSCRTRGRSHLRTRFPLGTRRPVSGQRHAASTPSRPLPATPCGCALTAAGNWSRGAGAVQQNDTLPLRIRDGRRLRGFASTVATPRMAKCDRPLDALLPHFSRAAKLEVLEGFLGRSLHWCTRRCRSRMELCLHPSLRRLRKVRGKVRGV